MRVLASAGELPYVCGRRWPPWGLEEARSLGILDVLLAAGGHCVKRSVGYGEDVNPARAEARVIGLDQLLPGAEKLVAL